MQNRIPSSDYAARIEELKRNVTFMLQERSQNLNQDNNASPAPIWIEALSIFDYLLHLTPEDFLKIRAHTSLVTGEPVFNYWHLYPAPDPEKFAYRLGYKFYTEAVPEAYWLSEPITTQIPRPLGVNYRNKIINGNIIRYQSCVSNLYSMGILNSLTKRQDHRSLVVEIGGGYGGLAQQLGSILGQNATYIILDLPEMFLLSGAYLIVNNPHKSVYVYHRETFTAEFLKNEIYNYDYVLLPNYLLPELYNLPEIDLIINMQSFQEMSREQIQEYFKYGQTKLSGYIYSDNVDCHPFNEDLPPETVTSLLSKHFSLFPKPEFYEKHAANTPWFYKIYVGAKNEGDFEALEGNLLKVQLQTGRCKVISQNGQTRLEIERDWMEYFISKAKSLLRR